MYISEGDFLCDGCFSKRKNSASSTSRQDTYEKNWGLYFVPVFGLGLLASRIKKDIVDICCDVWNLYFNGRHEVWHDNRTNDYNKKKCDDCKNFYSYYYELVNLKY